MYSAEGEKIEQEKTVTQSKKCTTHKGYIAIYCAVQYSGSISRHPQQ